MAAPTATPRASTPPRWTASGAVGDGAHAAHEQARIPQMVERCALLVLLLMAPILADDEPEPPRRQPTGPDSTEGAAMITVREATGRDVPAIQRDLPGDLRDRLHRSPLL